jgi:hypothetical protein
MTASKAGRGTAVAIDLPLTEAPAAHPPAPADPPAAA